MRCISDQNYLRATEKLPEICTDRMRSNEVIVRLIYSAAVVTKDPYMAA